MQLLANRAGKVVEHAIFCWESEQRLRTDCFLRVERLRARLSKEGLPALLVTDVTNVTWLTGFTGEASWLLVAPGRLLLFSDSRFAQQIEEECPGLLAEIRQADRTTLDLAAEVVSKLSLPQLGIEAASITRATSDDLSAKLPATQLVCTSGWVETLRSIKDDDELERIRHSIAICERTFGVIRNQLRWDQTEKEIGHAIEHEMRKLGAERCAFPPIVGVGPRAALPHARLTSSRVGDAPFVLIDWGAFVDGYASDLTRVVFTDPPPSKVLEIYNVVRLAQQAAIGAIRPGAELAAVDKAARNTITDAGYGDFFGHGLGHGFGMQVHEQPFIRPTSTGTFSAGMVVTVEPGIYLPGVGGVRIEDDVLVTTDGCQRLSSLPTEWEELAVELL